MPGLLDAPVRAGTLQLVPSASTRVTRRGLLIADASVGALLIAHPDPAALAVALGQPTSAESLRTLLSEGCDDPAEVDESLANLLEIGLLTGPDLPAEAPLAPGLRLDRTGLYVPGIDRIAARIAGLLAPVLRPLPLLALGALAALGVAALLAGAPAGPRVSDHPALDAWAGLALMLLMAAAHELGHAVALARYGRRPGGAGVGFYWGMVCFFVDSAEAVTLPRRARIVQALAGLGVDAVAIAALVGASHLLAGTVSGAIAWRIAVVSAVSAAINAAPFLRLDGHWALSDALDEPDLAARAAKDARRLLGGHRPERPLLALYGLTSAFAGLALLVMAAVVWYAASHQLVHALAAGTWVDRLTLVAVFGPTAVGLVLTLGGLVASRSD